MGTVNRTGHRLQGAFRRLREISGKLGKSQNLFGLLSVGFFLGE